ncbi:MULTISPECIES: acyl-CoA thioesterase [unclassified Pseudomonas]|jgi:acyl-CoA thioesterase FadM|uniref:acyl-CoA thioesterase n=1 Tax=unclassified Pseudomonas TaxID=196821 RepID=UPI000C84A283|nr:MULTISPECIES: thioesterase family protein [unclassified Pseudomonas]MDX9669121.1 thioesterase family protein [Pseudomonas sp. P8_250]WPN36835.1 thioesterase family protein [Pseudomonas sp. P8_139]WPN41364.1 thioesterase family protein [Pseudomonas sp. P8_229]
MPDAVFVNRTVLFGDCDPAGVVYTPRFSYFAVEAIGIALDRWVGAPGLRTLMGFNILPPVRAMSIELLAPVTWDDEMIIKVGVAKLGEHSFTFLVEGFSGKGVLSFTANITHVCISPDSKEVVPIPAPLRVLLS